MNAVIETHELCKDFLIKTSVQGFWPTLKAFITPSYETCHAIKNLSFTIQRGEKVAFLGANGAGKSTALKMLTGILYPSRGKVRVHNLTPWQHRKTLAYQMGMIFGQRSRLWFHLPARDTYHFMAKIYGLSKNEYEDRVEEIIRILELERIIDIPVKQLSLGQRMRCEIGVTLLHRPSILFLDEPTIGIDIHSKLAIRTYLNRLSREEGLTILLTSHDVGDIEHVCDRAIILKEGTKIIDQPIDHMKLDYLHFKRINLKMSHSNFTTHLPGVKVVECLLNSLTLEIDTRIMAIEKAISLILATNTVTDISIMSPPLEEIIRAIYLHKHVMSAS